MEIQTAEGDIKLIIHRLKFDYMPINYTPTQVTHLLALERPLEEAKESGQTEAVHVVQLTEVADHEEQLAAVLSQWQVGTALLRTRT